jgi:hypothetical protein
VPNPQHPARITRTPPILIMNGLHDPATGYEWAVDVARQIDDSGTRHALPACLSGRGCRSDQDGTAEKVPEKSPRKSPATRRSGGCSIDA